MRRLLAFAVVSAALVVADQTVLAPSSRAAAINVSDAEQHRIRYAVNRYVQI